MTQDEIIEMANEAGFFLNINCQIPGFEKFAELVAAKEREACAKICDSWGIGEAEGAAQEIRARGQA